MTFYTIADQTVFFVNRHGLRVPETVIEHELITEREMHKRGLMPFERYFQTIDRPRNRNFWSFGARFAMEG